ncbi:class I SAM-dependent methyltransferase [Candidatus Borrarchaeum sp.]|uniref:class I SAM-dependent methyltransferase n=1 Tax=Candidatus Borrarchaeum sp. TaxID=2846742 RepID=UPI00257B8B6F|nr:class I SAM-dependent methyltransferase [Candidatus Borrarchaeum sp.]
MPELNEFSYKKRIMKLYSEPSYVKTYDRRYNSIQREKYEIILPYLENHPLWILDVGIGTGLFLNKVVRQWTLIGTDLSLRMLHIAKKRAKKNTNVELVLADADYLPFKERIFQIVTTFTLLQNVPNPLKTIQELKRVSDNLVAITVLKKKINVLSLREFLKKSGVTKFNIIERESEDIFAVCYVT